jgi:DNA repair exonuclease SbcCD ATPase subunit
MEMSEERFVNALRAELDAVVARYEALVRAHEQTLSVVREREVDALRGEIAALRSECDRERARAADLGAEVASLRGKVSSLERDLASAREEAAREREAASAAVARATQAFEEERRRAAEVLAEARAAAEAAEELQGTFAAERSFVEACRGLEGSMLMAALEGALGRALDRTAATSAALKARGLDNVLAQAVRERGRQVTQAPLLEREKAAIGALAAAANCALIIPEAGVRFSPGSMDKAASVSDPAEEGNVVECLVPGLRLAGTDGSLVLPRVVVATG